MPLNTPQINELIKTPDAIEIIRDRLAALLSLEIQHQHALAWEEADPDIDLEDYDVKIYIENARPYDTEADDDGNATPIKRFVNITLPKAVVPSSKPSGNQKETVTFFIDCVACGNDGGDFRDDRNAALRAWRVMRLVRRILMSSAYIYLGMQGIVGQRAITSMVAGTPDKPELGRESALSYVVIRGTLEVTFLEGSIDAPFVIMEAPHFEVNPVTGEVVAQKTAVENVMGL